MVNLFSVKCLRCNKIKFIARIIKNVLKICRVVAIIEAEKMIEIFLNHKK